MRKATLLTPIYISLAWTLMISYQLFTETAVKTTTLYIGYLIPSISNWLNMRLETIAFVYAFAWIFVLSTVLPRLILGRNRSVIVQFTVCLMITLISFIIQDGFFSQIDRGGT